MCVSYRCVGAVRHLDGHTHGEQLRCVPYYLLVPRCRAAPPWSRARQAPLRKRSIDLLPVMSRALHAALAHQMHAPCSASTAVRARLYLCAACWGLHVGLPHPVHLPEPRIWSPGCRTHGPHAAILQVGLWGCGAVGLCVVGVVSPGGWSVASAWAGRVPMCGHWSDAIAGKQINSRTIKLSVLGEGGAHGRGRSMSDCAVTLAAGCRSADRTP